MTKPTLHRRLARLDNDDLGRVLGGADTTKEDYTVLDLKQTTLDTGEGQAELLRAFAHTGIDMSSHDTGK